jgi:hypothetical protein
MCAAAAARTVISVADPRRHTPTKEPEVKRIILSLTAVAALGAAVATVAAASDSGSASSSQPTAIKAAPAAKRTTSFTVFLPGTKSQYVDTGAGGYSRGDYFLARGALMNHDGGTRVGGLAGIWTILSQAADDASIMFHLKRGTIYVDGRVRHTTPQNVLRIAGGTGRYADASGRAVFEYLSDTTAQVTFTVHS